MKLFCHGLAVFMSAQGKFHGNIWNNFTQAALHQPLQSYAQRMVGALQQSNAAPCQEATLTSQARGWESLWLGEPWRPNISKIISLRAKWIVVETCFTLMLAKTSPSSLCATDTLMIPHARFGDVLYFSSSAFYFLAILDTSTTKPCAASG